MRGCWIPLTIWQPAWHGMAIPNPSTLRKPTPHSRSAGRETTASMVTPSSTSITIQPAWSPFLATRFSAFGNGADRKPRPSFIGRMQPMAFFVASWRETKKGLPMTENTIAKDIVDAAFRIHTALGPGLLESVYDAVLAFE